MNTTTMKSTDNRQFARLTTGPLPLTGLITGEDQTISGKPLWRVLVYGYSAFKPEYWAKDDCKVLNRAELSPAIDIGGWLRLATGRF